MLRFISRALYRLGLISARSRRATYQRARWDLSASRSRFEPPNPSSVRHGGSTAPVKHRNTVSGRCYVIDGDTICIGNVRIRLAGIDAPELDHPRGKKAKWELAGLCKGQTITAELAPDISYDRVVATCFLPDGRDLSAEMVKRGLALDWPKFSGGKYSHLEPDDARKLLWRAAARQRGHMQIFNK